MEIAASFVNAKPLYICELYESIKKHSVSK